MGRPVDLERIRAAEQALGMELPAVLVEHLRRSNGGDVLVECGGEEADEWQLHPVWDDIDRRSIRSSANHIVRETEEARQWPAFPPDAATIAAEGTGDHLIVTPSGEIALWSHETGERSPVRVRWQSIDES